MAAWSRLSDKTRKTSEMSSSRRSKHRARHRVKVELPEPVVVRAAMMCGTAMSRSCLTCSLRNWEGVGGEMKTAALVHVNPHTLNVVLHRCLQVRCREFGHVKNPSVPHATVDPMEAKRGHPANAAVRLIAIIPARRAKPSHAALFPFGRNLGLTPGQVARAMVLRVTEPAHDITVV